jgi:hypothetical protein
MSVIKLNVAVLSVMAPIEYHQAVSLVYMGVLNQGTLTEGRG